MICDDHVHVSYRDDLEKHSHGNTRTSVDRIKPYILQKAANPHVSPPSAVKNLRSKGGHKLLIIALLNEKLFELSDLP